MAASLTTSPSSNGNLTKLILAWTSAADGSVALPLAGLAGTALEVVGLLHRVVFVPGTGGVQPSDAYDVTITDAAGLDILSGQGANLSQSTASEICPSIPMKDGATTSTIPRLLKDNLTLNVANAGNAKSGTIYLYTKWP